MAAECRTGMDDISEKLGYLVGSLDGLHKKVDKIDDKVGKNAGRITAVEKRQDKARNIVLGASMPIFGAWTYVILQWNKIQQFFGGVFGGGYSG